MASLTRKQKARRGNKRRKAGRKRKRKLGKRSTRSARELFAGLGEPADR